MRPTCSRTCPSARVCPKVSAANFLLHRIASLLRFLHTWRRRGEMIEGQIRGRALHVAAVLGLVLTGMSLMPSAPELPLVRAISTMYSATQP